MSNVIIVFIVVVCLFLLWAILDKYFIYPTYKRVTSYLFLYYAITQLKVDESEQDHILCALVLSRHDYVLNLLTSIRNDPERTNYHIKISLEIMTDLRSIGYSETTLLRTSLNYLKQYREYGFQRLPSQIVDEESIAIIQYLEKRFSKCPKIQPVQCTFWFMVANKRIKDYLQY